MIPFLYLLFFLSGASALIYEVAWVRQFSLVFGGSHLAVTTVLSVFMGGLAIGSYFFGKRVEDHPKPLRLYGLLEVGIAVSAASLLFLLEWYPYLYGPLARLDPDNPVYLSFLRIVFAASAMIVPTTLMGGTLPILTRFISAGPGPFGKHLSFLYGFNTIGAVAGTLGAGFLLIPSLGLRSTMAVAIGVNAVIGLLTILLQEKTPFPVDGERGTRQKEAESSGEPSISAPAEPGVPASVRFVLWGIGISGFCALGYEVLWTRVLSMVIGATVYSFTIMLVAFLTGIAAGSVAYGLFLKIFGEKEKGSGKGVARFGIVQVLIGAAALLVTYTLRDLPAHAIRIQNFLLGTQISEFEVRQGANLLVAFSYMFAPAFLMGMAFPMAGKIRSAHVKRVGKTVGEVMAYNTLGAILGAAISGFVLIYLFGIERSLQLLTAVNIGTGLLVAASATGRPLPIWIAAGATAGILLALALNPGRWKGWDQKYFAIYRNNQREAFDTPEKIRDAMENTEVLYFNMGIDETISVIRVKGADQALLVNGKVVSSSTRLDVQCVMTLGHLPMLLHPKPKRVWVLGLGTGITLGAVSVHPELEEVTLAEIERNVIPAARTFRRLNHDVLDNPKLRIVFNDGRNFLLTTTEKYDVITADPVHPWAQGAAYLYTDEYYHLAADRLLPGGIMCQWLPIYELTEEDLKSVVKTFGRHFRYTLLWVTQYDAELIGSNSPIVIDEAELGRRMAVPEIANDLQSVDMGFSADILSYFVSGTRGLEEFGRDGIVNTDDNLYLEFSAPRSVGVNTVGRNLKALYRYREDILPYLVPAKGEHERFQQEERWRRRHEASRIYDRAHAMFFTIGAEAPETGFLVKTLEASYPWYAPGRFLHQDYRNVLARVPTLLKKISFPFLSETGGRTVAEIDAVLVRVGSERAAVVFVDNRARFIYGQRYFDGPAKELDESIGRFVEGVFAALEEVYRKEAIQAKKQGKKLPDSNATHGAMRAVIEREVRGN